MAKRDPLSSASLDELEAELNRRRKKLPRLQAKQKKLQAELASLDEQIALLESLPGSGKKSSSGKAGKTRRKSRKRARRTRAKNQESLADVLAKQLQGKSSVGIGEAMDLAKQAGYQSSSQQFRNIVNQTLSKDPRFKKTGRGKYALK